MVLALNTSLMAWRILWLLLLGMTTLLIHLDFGLYWTRVVNPRKLIGDVTGVIFVLDSDSSSPMSSLSILASSVFSCSASFTVLSIRPGPSGA